MFLIVSAMVYAKFDQRTTNLTLAIIVLHLRATIQVGMTTFILAKYVCALKYNTFVTSLHSVYYINISINQYY